MPRTNPEGDTSGTSQHADNRPSSITCIFCFSARRKHLRSGAYIGLNEHLQRYIRQKMQVIQEG